MAKLQRFDPGAQNDWIFDAVARDGAAIVEGVLNRPMLEALRTELAPDVEAGRPGSVSGSERVENFHGRNTKRICSLARRSAAFVDLMLHPLMLAYGDRFLLGACRDYWLNTGQLMIVGPGEPAQRLHRDEGNWPYQPWPGPEITVSSMWSLSDFTAAVGATRVVPGSHLWTDREREATEDEVTQAVMPAGSVLLYSGKVEHGAGANKTEDAWRWGLHVSYVAGWLRPEENHNMAVPLAIARRLPERAQTLLGYTSYVPDNGGRLGLVEFEDAALVTRGAAPA
jgi:ectoine hydroxylase-related dioxygenase (phytanoyl-CoA dioxygenase family)